MKRLFFTTLILPVLAMSTFAQERVFKLGASVSPNYSTAVIVNDGTVSPALVRLFRESEVGKPSLSASVFIEFSLNEKLKASIGVGYLNNGFGTRTKEFNAIDPDDPFIPASMRAVYNQHHFEVPLNVHYHLSERIYAAAGVSAAFNVINSATTISKYADGRSVRSTNSFEKFRPVNVFASAGFGFNYVDNGSVVLYLQPYAQYALLGAWEAVPLNRYYRSVGLITGIKI